MSSARLRQILGTTALSLSLAACARVAPAPPAPPPLPTGDIARAAQARGAEVRTLRALYEVEVTLADGAQGFDAVAAVGEGGALRLEVLGPFGGTRVVAVADGRAFAAYETTEKTYFRGAATAANLARVLRVPVDPATLSRALLGRALVIVPLVPPVASRDGPFARLLAADALGRLEHAWLDPRTARLLRLEVTDPDGALTLAASFERWSEDEGPSRAVPERLRLEFPSVGARIVLEADELERNPSLDSDLFRLRRPAGARVVDLDAET
ncbi:MAG: DUF4292 domain-containing protein [Myxococcales bacterium]|nr:DUF4292 domain-containing protein [Myxococcales bacterium]